MDFWYLFYDFIYCRCDLQKWINRRYKNSQVIHFDMSICSHFPYIVTHDGIKYKLSKNIQSICEAARDYDYNDLRKDDICIDIGANVGGFSIPASYICDKVYAIEPITGEELKENIELNKRKIAVIEKGLGDGSKTLVSWQDNKKEIQTLSFTQIKELCGGCDYLKCDCEGAEWFIQPNELEGVRRLEMEIHFKKDIKKTISDELMHYILSHYDVKIEKNTDWEAIHNKWVDTFTDVKILHAKRIKSG